MGCGVICAVCSRFQLLLLSSIAIGGSLVTTFSCQFFTYRALDGEVWEGFDVPPFSKLSEASVGLFSFSESLESTDALGSACERYNDWKFVGQSDEKYFQLAQVASMVAPLLAFLGWVQILIEFLCCRLYGGWCLMSTLFLLAAAAQACTFLIFADTEFCLEPESVNECTLELGSYYSLGAAILYIILSCLVSNTPPSPGQRNQGCCVYTGWKDKEASSHPREITTPADPEMAPKSLNHPSTEQEEVQDEEEGRQEEIIEEEVLVMQDENGQQIVVEEEEIIEDADGNQVVVEEQEIVEGENGEQMVVEEELVVEDANGNQVVVEEEVVEEVPPDEQPTTSAADI